MLSESEAKHQKVILCQYCGINGYTIYWLYNKTISLRELSFFSAKPSAFEGYKDNVPLLYTAISINVVGLNLQTYESRPKGAMGIYCNLHITIEEIYKFVFLHVEYLFFFP